MEKSIIKEGEYIERDGKLILHMYGADLSICDMFQKSLFDISGADDLYNFKKLKGTDCFYIYRKYGLSDLERHNPEEVEERLKKILNGNWADVINKEDLTIGITAPSRSRTVFWDVFNNVIFVKGKDNLKRLCVDIHMAGYERLGIKRSDKTDGLYIARALNNEMLVELFELSQNQNGEVDYIKPANILAQVMSIKKQKVADEQ